MRIFYALLAVAGLSSLYAQTEFLDHPPPPAKIIVPDEGVAVPMLNFGGRPVVEVMINGKGPYKFILDTGASITVVASDLAQELSLPGPAAAWKKKMEGMGQAQIAELGLGGAKLIDVAVATDDNLKKMFRASDPPRGVLSAAVAPGCLLTLDYPAKQVLLRKGALPEPDSKTVFVYTKDQVLPNVPLRIGDKEFRVHVDSGSPALLMLHSSFMKDVKLSGEPQEVGLARTAFGEFKIYAAELNDAVYLGQFKLDVPRVDFSEMNAVGGPPMGNIGYRLLKNFKVTLDAKNLRVKFEQ